MKKCLAILLTLVVSASAWAVVPPPQPEKCPAVESIQQNKIVTAIKSSDGSYGAILLNKFDTKEMWGFVIAEIMANSSQEALTKAKEAVNTLTFLSGPTYFATSNIWGCVYRVEAGYPVLALTPLPTQIRNADTLLN